MLRLPQVFLITFLTSQVLTTANAQTPGQKLDRFVAKLIQNQKFSGTILVAEQGKTVYQKSAGYADFSTKVPNTQDIAFPIASLSKTLTAISILQLMEQGKVNIDTPVSNYLPSFPYAQITVRHLLSHTSGLPPYNAYFNPIRAKDSSKIFTNIDFLPAVVSGKNPLIYSPGEKGNYDNVNYIVLALLIERLSGLSYAEYIQRYLLEPAGMKHTWFMPLAQQFNTDTLAHFAYPHLYLRVYDDRPTRSNTVPYIRNYWKTFALTGFGDYISTVEDILLYDKALYENRLLKAETLREAFRPVLLTNGKPHPDLFGLGWEVEADTSLGQVVYHSGAAISLSCVMIRNLIRHQTVILFDNTHFNAHEVGTKLLKILNGQPVALPKKSLAHLYGLTLLKQGEIRARNEMNRLKKDTRTYLSERTRVK
ncbi:serine hydrolase domain-containing protein [Spirosoma linguale]|uniref:Beta-lactamase n=1 Tax=Spirosoma linguale (strain ATCC 33905 / DSM 74 / LMG 10896 / Claus 1) TaxID=504472 RepID=D2QI04_SPILD|nr:beta-lactamase [Spirosoma linguale DSM 74]